MGVELTKTHIPRLRSHHSRRSAIPVSSLTSRTAKRFLASTFARNATAEAPRHVTDFVVVRRAARSVRGVSEPPEREVISWGRRAGHAGTVPVLALTDAAEVGAVAALVGCAAAVAPFPAAEEVVG